MPVTEVIIEKIRKEGAISFHDFMEMALYFPSLGYYTSARNKIGQTGDFYTSPYLSALFGEMIASQFEEMWQLLGRQPFTIVEQGAGMGVLCRDILRRLRNNVEMYAHLNYIIVEKSAYMRGQEKLILGDEFSSKVSWCDNLREVRPVSGCIFSNELVDNFAVHQVIMQEQLMEIFVSYSEKDGFVEMLQPAGPELTSYFEELKVTLPSGFRTEVNLEAVEWLKTISAVLQKGFVLTIDYGCSSSDLYDDMKRTGTLLCYKDHQRTSNPYDNIGKQDITTHVNFSALKEWGNRQGLQYCGFTNQAYFLRGLGVNRYMRELEKAYGDMGADDRNRWAIVHTLLMEMGNKFKVLIQRKGIDPSFISGLQFPQRLV